jgi:hypothetical protein
LSVRLFRSDSVPGRELLWGDQTRTEGVSPPRYDLKREHAAECRYVPAAFAEGEERPPWREDPGLVVQTYGPESHLVGEWPYRLVVVTEERWEAGRWLGGPRKLCHALTYEVHSTGPERNAVLLVGLRDCRTSAKQVPRIIPRESFLAYVSQASPPGAPYVDATSTYKELPAGHAHIGK